jgi:general secretion pathway protein J
MSTPGVTSYGDGQAGATLVEMLAALAVVALTLVAAASGLRQLAGSADRGAQVIARHDMFSSGIAVLRRDVERLERVVWKRGQNTEFAFHADATNLTFVAIEPPFPSEAGPYFVGYAIVQRPDGDVLTRGRAPFDLSTADIRRLPTQDLVTVLEGPYRFRFTYLDRKDGREQWIAQWSDPYRLPDLIGLEIRGRAEGGRPMLPIIFRPRIDAERACVKEEGVSCTIGSRGVLKSESQ